MDFPDPDTPTRATVWPGCTRRSKPDRTGSSRRYPKLTSWKTTSPRTGGSATAPGRSATLGTESSRSKMRSAPARACCPTVSRPASIRAGDINRTR